MQSSGASSVSSCKQLGNRTRLGTNIGVGVGAFQSHFYAELYPASVLKICTNINHLEAVNLVHALTFLMPPDPVKHNIIVNTDNLASQLVLNSGHGKDAVFCACAR